jgi:predicted glycoside hydrolase/deacetylase ChbG (UPF0249 family)
VKLCINADDFGIHEQVNLGICDAVHAGLINSVSVMANHPAAAHVTRDLAQTPTSVGLHFSLTSGTNKVAPSCDRPIGVCNAWIRKSLTPEILRCELDAQLAALRSFWNGAISHLDTHEHIHAFPPLRKVLIEFAAENDIPHVRNPTETSPAFALKKTVLGMAFKNMAPTPRTAFFGLNLMGKAFTTDNICRQLDFLSRKGVSQAIWMVHVGHSIPQADRLSRDYEFRARELEVLMSLRDELPKRCDLVPMQELK